MILLDHIEDLLDGDGLITDDAIRKLVDRSLAERGGPRLIVTSRIRLALSREAAKLDRPVILSEGLSVEDGIAMLRDLDRGSGLKQLPDEALARVVKRLHGVPRALEVFAGILAGRRRRRPSITCSSGSTTARTSSTISSRKASIASTSRLSASSRRSRCSDSRCRPRRSTCSFSRSCRASICRRYCGV